MGVCLLGSFVYLLLGHRPQLVSIPGFDRCWAPLWGPRVSKTLQKGGEAFGYPSTAVCRNLATPLQWFEGFWLALCSEGCLKRAPLYNRLEYFGEKRTSLQLVGQ